MINIADLPAVREQLERDLTARKEAEALVERETSRFARAPAASGSLPVARAPSTQGNTR